MPNRFSRVDTPHLHDVTVRLWRSADCSRGEVIGPGRTGYRAGEAGNLSHEEALAIGCTLANTYGLSVVVMDPDGIWPTRWGDLVDHHA